jgi:hypothetical protein
MAKQFQKFPRITYSVYDESEQYLGDVVAKNEHEALDRANATYGEMVRRVEVKNSRTAYVQAAP